MTDKIAAFFALDNICSVFLTIIIYSFVGWFFETMLHILRDRKVVKRGFLFGPICPIYGVGAIIEILILYGRTENIFYLFGAGFLICGVLEFTTHLILEKCFHAMWWDYSSRRFNIQGRVYLNGLLFMGAGSAILIRFIHPLIDRLYHVMPGSLLHFITFIVYSLLIADVATTISDLKNSVGYLKRILNIAIEESQNFVDTTEEKINDVAHDIKNDIKGNERVMEIINRLNGDKSPLKKFRNRYPNINFEKYKEILEIIRDKPDEKKARKDIKLYGEENDFSEDEKEKEEKK